MKNLSCLIMVGCAIPGFICGCIYYITRNGFKDALVLSEKFEKWVTSEDK